MRAESSPAARTGVFIAVALALFCIQLDFFEFGVTASAAQWTLSLLTFLVTLGGVALAGAAAAITAMTPEWAPEAAYDAILRSGGAVILAASVVVMAVRHRLVVLGQVPPLGSRVTQGGGPP
jgi:hypothetical protein